MTGSRCQWLCRSVAAFILLIISFRQLMGAPEALHIFQQVGAEPWGRYVVAAMQLVGAVLLVVPVAGWVGSLIGLLISASALLAHGTILGLVIKGDAGLHFAVACLAFVCCLIVFCRERCHIHLHIFGFHPHDQRHNDSHQGG